MSGIGGRKNGGGKGEAEGGDTGAACWRSSLSSDGTTCGTIGGEGKSRRSWRGRRSSSKKKAAENVKEKRPTSKGKRKMPDRRQHNATFWEVAYAEEDTYLQEFTMRGGGKGKGSEFEDKLEGNTQWGRGRVVLRLGKISRLLKAKLLRGRGGGKPLRAGRNSQKYGLGKRKTEGTLLGFPTRGPS